MSADNAFEKMIVENVIKELAKKGMLQGNESVALQPVAGPVVAAPVVFDDQAVTVPSDEILVPNPVSLAEIRAMKQATPARIGIWRAGARPKTVSWLRFLADHAAAQDAVFTDVSDALIRRLNLVPIQSAAKDRDEFLTRPENGRKLSDEAIRIVKEKGQANSQVQILVVDGLSSSAIEANVPDLLPALVQGLNAQGIKPATTTFFIKYGRVWVQDPVAMLLNSEVVISLIGERPGLVTADSLSAYIIYRPNENTVEADRTVISNIHKGGIPPAEAGAHLATLLKQILDAKASGVKFNKVVK
jgi:ethanolamine ammonia-lyase small subunit